MPRRTAADWSRRRPSAVTTTQALHAVRADEPTPTAEVTQTEVAHPLGGSRQWQRTVVPGPDVGRTPWRTPPRIAGGVGHWALRAVEGGAGRACVAPTVRIQAAARPSHPETSSPCTTARARIRAPGSSIRPTSSAAPDRAVTLAIPSGIRRSAGAHAGDSGQEKAKQEQT